MWVQTFGNFRVWLGDRFVETQDWKREKARQFFQILMAQGGKWVHKDQINEWLWPESSGDSYTSYLKVIYNAANQVLEPDRPRGEDPFFIERRQESYRLNPKARLIVDADLFVQKISQASLGGLENALSLYRGRYLAGSPMSEWLTNEEQYYHQQFMLAADRLLNHYIETDDYSQALDTTYQILNEDPFWEAAYRAQMLIFHQLGQHTMVYEVYHRCIEMVSEQLNAPISHETEDLYQQLIPE